jgi:transcriptional regulator with XRE-family HTH domain
MARQLTIKLNKLRETVAGKRMGATIARELQVSTNTFNRWMTGNSPLTIERLNQICQRINIDIDEFVEIKIAA